MGEKILPRFHPVEFMVGVDEISTARQTRRSKSEEPGHIAAEKSTTQATCGVGGGRGGVGELTQGVLLAHAIYIIDADDPCDLPRRPVPVHTE